MSKDSEVRRQPEQDDSHIKWFRQTRSLAEILYILGKNGNYPCDPETGRILLDRLILPESEGFISIFSRKEGIAEPDARKTEIVNESSTWLRILPNGDVEIKYENNRYDLNRVIPPVDIDDVPELIKAMAHVLRETMRKAEEDPIGTYAEQAAASEKTLLGRDEELVVLSRGGAQVWRLSEEYGHDEILINREETGPEEYLPSSEACLMTVSYYRFNMFNQLSDLLKKAVISEAAEYYQALFTPEVRQKIQRFALEEARQNALNGEGPKDKEEVRISGGVERVGMTFYPQVGYSVSSVNKMPNGKIRIEYTHVLVDPQEKISPPFLDRPRLSKVFQYHDEIGDVVEDWVKARRQLVGEPAFDQEALAHLSELKEQMASNEGSAHGHIRVIALDPLTGKYQYYFLRRSYSKGSGEPNVEVETHFSDTQNPHPDELLMLLSFAL